MWAAAEISKNDASNAPRYVIVKAWGFGTTWNRRGRRDYFELEVKGVNVPLPR